MGGEDEGRTNQWIYEIENKRMIYADIYRDIIKGECRASIV